MSLDGISYTLFFGVIFVCILYMYIQLKYGFWAMQPVYHVYNWNYMINPRGIIDSSLPEPNKYTNFKQIETILFDKLTSIQQTRFTNLIKAHYLQNEDNVFNPKQNNIVPYFVGNNDKTFASFFYEDNYLIDSKNGNLVTDKKIVGSITSRPLYITINNKNTNNTFRAYYVDYLCVDKLHRKKGIAPQLIQTHHYNQRLLNKKICVSLFKREDELTGIVPLCTYTTYGFSVKTWTKPPELSSQYTLLKINDHNYTHVMDFIGRNHTQFDIIINTEISNTLELLKTKNIFIYVILNEDSIMCCYYFRKSCVQVEKGLEVLSCYASICDCEPSLFIDGFKISFWKIAAENHFGFSAIENVSHNNIIINNLLLKSTPLIQSPTAYFFYNFAYPTFAANKTLILN